jgi:FAS-associated factor 2
LFILSALEQNNARRPNNNSAGSASSLFASSSWLMNLFSLVLRTLFWPLRRIGDLLLPAGEYDGLSTAVTEKATQQFAIYLKGLASSNTSISSGVSDAFSTSSFSALKQEAAATQSLILVYLHSPVHRQAGELCQKFLLNSQFLDWITQNNGTHIIGGVRAMGSSIHTSQGSSLSFQLAVASFPCIALLQPSPSSASSGSNGNGSYNRAEADHKPLKLVFKAEGPALIKMTSSQLLNLIKTTYQRHQIIVQEREARRIEREQEQQLRRQQDAEYQEALRADQERERQRQEEEELQKRVQKEEEENEKKKIQEEKDRLEKAKALVRPEPANVKGKTTRIRFQLPTGQKLERRFENDATVGALKAFLILHFAETCAPDQVIKNISLSTNFPKKTYDDDSKTLKESDLCPQAVLMCQDLDA